MQLTVKDREDLREFLEDEIPRRRQRGNALPLKDFFPLSLPFQPQDLG